MTAGPPAWPGTCPATLLFFVGLVRVGLGGDFAAGMVITVLAATTVVAVLVTLRALNAERWARRAAPFLVLTPAAVFMSVSADALIGAVVAWGLACLALATRGLWWAVPAGLLLGTAVMMSYGMPLMGLVAVAVLVALAGGSWRPLPVAAAAALAVVLAFAAMGFAWLTLSFALLPDPWRRWGLGLQVVMALVVQHLLYTVW